MKIAIIGTGNMGSAIAASLVNENVDLTCTARSAATLQRISRELPSVKTDSDNRSAVNGADMIVLAVKPYIAPEVINEIKGHIKSGASIVSVIAGMTIEDLKNSLSAPENSLEVFRVIPNTAIKYRKSVTFISHSEDCDPEAAGKVEDIFSLSGKVFVVKEKEMAACTAIASCGIAFFLRFIRAMAEGGVELGLPAAFATEVAALTAGGAASVLKDGAHPEAEIDKVTTPGGITIKGLNAMEEHGFNAAVIAALRATCPEH